MRNDTTLDLERVVAIGWLGVSDGIRNFLIVAA